VSGEPTGEVPRIGLRWPDEVAETLGVSRSWLYESSGLQEELRFWGKGRVQVVLIADLERTIERLSVRWDERDVGLGIIEDGLIQDRRSRRGRAPKVEQAHDPPPTDSSPTRKDDA
jgi:hypothetical protein